MADEPDIPMLDVGDFEVLDECASDDEIVDDEYEEDFDRTDFQSEEDDGEHENSNRRNQNPKTIERDDPNLDENSGDNGDNVLDVNIDVSENEFLESVAKDFSENLEEEVSESPRVLRSAKKAPPSVQKRNLIKTEPEPPSKKRPGPKSKTMNTQALEKKPIQKITFKEEKKTIPKQPFTPKKPIQKITFNKNEFENKNKENKIENNKTSEVKAENKKDLMNKKSNVSPKTVKMDVQKSGDNKTPAFLQKKDLTDEEIMMHFDEIENTVLASDTFVIDNDTEVHEVEDAKLENLIEEKGENKNEEENWDNCDNNPKKKPIKVEEENFAEHELWYKDKLKIKKKLVEEKFLKLAKYIQYQYPHYKKWMDRNEATYGTAICRMDPAKYIPLDQLRPNRWKFICSKKQIQQSSEEEKKEGDTSSESKSTQFCWLVVPGVPDANVDNPEEYPPFVMKVVKVFEEFLQSLEEKYSKVEVITIEEDENNKENKDKKDVQATDTENNKENAKETNKIDIKNLDGLTILLRSNRKNDLMVNITAKNISDDFLEQIKALFETGAGKDCNVKSLYCKTIIKENNVIKTNNNFLWGSETLEDNIGNVRIQLTPQSNLWINLAGFEVMANVIQDFLSISKNTSVIEIGCGKGLTSLLLATNCQKIIGLDTHKEIQEAEATAEFNEIKNATFVTGKPKVVMGQIEKALENAAAVAIINNNNTYGRSPDIVTAIRKMTSVARIVLITNLTKASIRTVLELAQPASKALGNPFIPTAACIVDTTPKNQYGYEIAISMERREMPDLSSGLISKSKKEAAIKQSGIIAIPDKSGAPAKFVKNFQVTTGFPGGKKVFPNPKYNPAAGKFQGKRAFPGNDIPSGPKKAKLGSNIRPNPMHNRDESDLRERLSSNRAEPAVIDAEMREQKKILDAAKEKLSGATSSSVDPETVKKLQEMLNLAIEKTNKLQSQLPPRSVWDRIAPADSENKLKNPVKGGSVKDKKIISNVTNNRGSPPTMKSKKYHNLPPLEPDIEPKPRFKAQSALLKKPSSGPYQKPGPNRFQKKPEPPIQSLNNWDRPPAHYKQNEPQRWGRPSPPPTRRPSPPRQMKWSPPPRQHSPPRRAFSPPRRGNSPQRRLMSPPRRPVSPIRRLMSPMRRPMSPPRRPLSPVFRGPQHASSSRNMMPPMGGRMNSPPRGRHDSPPRRPISPVHNFNRPSSPRQNMQRQKSPPRRYADEWDIPSRGAVQESGGWSRGGPPTTTSGWNQGPLDNGRFRPENDKWGNGGSGSSAWDNKGPTSTQNNSNRWKDPLPSLMGSNWDVQTKEASIQNSRNDFRSEPQRHEQRPEPRHEPRHEPRWEPPKEVRNDKDDYELPEDARDPWGDDPPQKEPPRWNQPSQPSQSSWTSRDKPNDNWSTSKPLFPPSNMLNSGPGTGGLTSGMNPGMNMPMSNQSKGPFWSGPNQQSGHQQPPIRTSGWGQTSNNWQGGLSGPNIGGGIFGMGGNNAMNTWPSQQNFSSYPSRPLNNPFMTGRR